jgi:purine catabolism regulator
VLAVEPADAPPEGVPQRRRLFESLAELCGRRSTDVLATVREAELVVLVPHGVDAQDLGRQALRQARELLPSWTLGAGVGGAAPTASAIARSYAQARRALETGRRFGRQGDVVTFEELGVYRLLFHVTDPAELRDFTDQVLGKLIEYDQRHGADFVRTLEAFLSHNGNVQATARELSLHVNSVTYRLTRIQAIAGLNLEAAEDRLLAQVALKILQ